MYKYNRVYLLLVITICLFCDSKNFIFSCVMFHLIRVDTCKLDTWSLQGIMS